MSKSTSVTIDGHCETFINDRVATGRFASANEVVHVESGFVKDFDRDEFLAELHREHLAKQ